MAYGIMQGRLLPCFKSNYQSHPVGLWNQEFELAYENNLKYIEFIVDAYLYHFNPILNREGLNEIKKIIELNSVEVKSICADIFMQWPLKNMQKQEINKYGWILENLVSNLSELGGSDIVLPFVDSSSLKNKNEMDFVASFLNDFEQICLRKNINLSLETDLKPETFHKFLSNIKNSKVRVNYDSGNSASLGYKFDEEVKLYGDKISNIHIKDRKFNMGPILLGEGDAELKKVKEFINREEYNGLVVFQAFRDNDPIKTFQKQYKYFMSL